VIALLNVRSVINDIIGKLRGKKGVLVAFSGGVDSSVVAALARLALGDGALAVTINSPLLPPGELEDAVNIARLIGIRHQIVELNELEMRGFQAIPGIDAIYARSFVLRGLRRSHRRKDVRLWLMVLLKATHWGTGLD